MCASRLSPFFFFHFHSPLHASADLAGSFLYIFVVLAIFLVHILNVSLSLVHSLLVFFVFTSSACLLLPLLAAFGAAVVSRRLGIQILLTELSQHF